MAAVGFAVQLGHEKVEYISVSQTAVDEIGFICDAVASGSTKLVKWVCEDPSTLHGAASVDAVRRFILLAENVQESQRWLESRDRLAHCSGSAYRTARSFRFGVMMRRPKQRCSLLDGDCPDALAGTQLEQVLYVSLSLAIVSLIFVRSIIKQRLQ